MIWRCLMIGKIWLEKDLPAHLLFASGNLQNQTGQYLLCFPMVPHFEMKNINIFYLIRSCMCAIDSKCICQLMRLQYLLYIWLVWLGQKLLNFTHLNTAFRWPGAWKRWSPQGSGKLGGCIVMHHCSPSHSNKDHIWELIWLFAVIIKCKWWPPQKDYQTPLLFSAISSKKKHFYLSCFWPLFHHFALYTSQVKHKYLLFDLKPCTIQHQTDLQFWSVSQHPGS